MAKCVPSPFVAGASEFLKAVSSASLWLAEPPPIAAKPSARARHNYEAYASHLAGRSVGDTLSVAEEWLRNATTKPPVIANVHETSWRRIHAMKFPVRRPT